MVFSSITFLYIFFPLVFLIYYIMPGKFKNIILLIASLIFYAWGEPVYVFLMILVALVNHISGKYLEKYSEDSKKRKMILILTIVIDLIILCFFKYANFLIANVNGILGMGIPLLDLALPIGISFYTFQAMSYTIDIYRKEVKAEKSFLNFLTYITLFPQLIAGPIVRYETISDELEHREVTFDKFSSGFIKFLRGMAKKVLIANNIGVLFTMIQNNGTEELSVLGAWLGVVAFALQIYFDFSGYSDMAIGMGKMFGFTFKENFNYPYIATSITDFWRRWHISLSSWFRDYVYIPLGGSRCKAWKNIRNILIVWMLTGFWHGSAWNFMLWGLYYGIILILEKFVWGKLIDKLPKILKHLYSLFFILIGWLIFAFDNINETWIYFKNMFGLDGSSIINDQTIYYLVNYAVIILLGIILSTPVIKILKEKIYNINNNALKVICNTFTVVVYVGMLVVCTAYLVDATYNPFLYFRF